MPRATGRWTSADGSPRARNPREGPDKCDEHRLMHEVDRKAVAPGPTERPGDCARGRVPAQRRENPRSSSDLRGGDPREKGRDPRKERLEIDGPYAVGREPEPCEPRGVERPGPKKLRRGESQGRGSERGCGRQAQEQEPRHARRRNGMQDAEKDERGRVRRKGRGRYQRRAAEDHCEAPPECRQADTLPVAEPQADAGEEEEACRDRPRVYPEEPGRRRAGRNEPEELQVEREVKARHGHKRQAPGEVQNRDTPLRLHLSLPRLPCP